MVRRIEVTMENGGEGWIDVSKAVEDAAIDLAVEENIPPGEAFERVTGLSASLFQ